VLVAVGLSVAELLTRVARPHDAVQGLVPGVAGMHDVDDYPEARTIPGLLVYRYDSPLFFANAEDFRRRALAAVDEQTQPVRWFVLSTEANVEVDITALDAVDELRRELAHPRHRLRPRPRQAGPAGRPDGIRPGRHGRQRADLPHSADGRDRIREVAPQSVGRPADPSSTARHPRGAA
jgi:MFS superfamily sulfate permease-like transporter